MIQNYQIWLDKELERITAEGKTPRLLLHACCAPCSSYVLEYLSRYFEITVLFYNPNISPASEFSYRVDELARLISEMPLKNPVELCVAHYEPAEFAAIAKGMEHLPEGGERCTACYHLRLEEAARAAKEGAYDYFTTTLSISPLKDARRLNNIGKELAVQYGVPYLYSDFKKREGYKRSIQLSAEHDLYRQDYCGCIYSKRDADNRKNK
jgi:predicted adenine nucleotide alpha hydrolase (AANH) superfamily ATPase